MNIRQIQEARETYGIDNWSKGFFGINDQGNVTCHPTGEEHLGIDMAKVIEACKDRNIAAPLILRFPQIIETQLERLHGAFARAIKEYNYGGEHRGVFPFKVNQRREVIDHIVESGEKLNYGLEIGSKTELVAAMSYDMGSKSLLVCNGFKDSEFIDLAFTATLMGKNVVLVVEGPDELEMIIDHMQDQKPCPLIGLRARLYSRGSGKWEKSSGETSKFGLTTIEVLQCLDMIDQANLKNNLAMLHFHIGSQITEIKRIKNAIKEASRVYAKIVKMGFSPRYLNIGGGVGVDYDGSKTSFASSANYTMQEFANDAVYEIGDVCRNEKVKSPDIVTESGRVIAAYHSVVVTNVREVQNPDIGDGLADIGISFDAKKSHKCLVELHYILNNINRKNFSEYYHDAVEYYEELFTLFNLGYVKLKDRALGEELFHRISRRALYFASFEKHGLEEFEDLQKQMVSKYLANFSMFQSIPDAWAIDQLFPVVPIAQHSQKPTHKGSIVDITCDSDGCLDRFVDRREEKRVLELHKLEPNKPYYIGFFLVGAYQESLSNEHNLFGAINEAEIKIKADGTWEIIKTTCGDSIAELLESRNYDLKELLSNYRDQLVDAERNNRIKKGKSVKFYNKLKKYIEDSPYLTEATEDILPKHQVPSLSSNLRSSRNQSTSL